MFGPLVLAAILAAPALPGTADSSPAPVGPGMLFIDVGQGAALLLLGTGHAVMIDAGPSGAAEAVVAALARHGVDRVDLWIHTHFDADHVGGFARAVAGADGLAGTADDLEVVDRWDRGLDDLPGTDAVAAYLAHPGPRREPAAGEVWAAPGLRVEVAPRAGAGEAAENARGLALCVRVGARSLLVPGDLPAALATEAATHCGPVDVLWASHHGGVDGTSEALLGAADPALVVVSAGADNPYCHPAPTTLARLYARAVWISGLAGAGPLAACEPLGPAFGPQHRLLAGDRWLAGGP